MLSVTAICVLGPLQLAELIVSHAELKGRQTIAFPYKTLVGRVTIGHRDSIFPTMDPMMVNQPC
jgi:hypothetical protein